MTSLYSGNLLDERNGRPIEGASLWVYDSLGAQATLTDIANQPFTQPILTGADGQFAYKAADGVYRHDFWKNSVKIYTDERVIVGVPGTLIVPTGAFGTTLVASASAASARVSLDVNSATASASSGGSALVAYARAFSGATTKTVSSFLQDQPVSVDEIGASIADADNGPEIKQAFDDMKQATSISYNPATIPMDARKSISLVGQYVIKSKIDLWAKTTVRALNGLNSGITLAADATDTAIFHFSGSTGLPAWGNQNRIEGGAYNVLKTGGAVVRKNPAFPRAFNAAGGSFMTNWAINDVSFAGPYGVILNDVYSQEAEIRNLHSNGTVERILAVQGHHILLDGIHKTGFTGTSIEPLIEIGDPDNINPTTHITLRNCVLDLNGNVNKDSVSIFNAKNTLIDGYHNELSAFKTMLKATNSYGTVIERPIFVTTLTTGIVELVNSDLELKTYESNNANKWWSAFTYDAQSPIHVRRLREFNSGVVPVVPNITVDEIQRVTSPLEKRLPIIAKDPIGNLLYNPAWRNGTLGWTIDAGATVTIVDSNEYIPGGKVLRISYATNQAGFKYVNQLIPFMTNAGFDDKAITLTAVGKVTRSGAQDFTSYMGPCASDFTIKEGRIYADQGLVFGSDIVVNSDGNAYFGIANARAGWLYEFHFNEANIGRQRSATLPLPMDIGWTKNNQTLFRGAYDGFTARTAPAAYDQAFFQTMINDVVIQSRRNATIENALRNIGAIDG